MTRPRLTRALRWARRWLRFRLPRRVWLALLIPAGLLAVGTVGYPLIEGPPWTHFDGFYMTAITLTTLGYGETHPLAAGGRVFTVVLAFGGIFTLFYLGTELVRSVVTGELRQAIGRERVTEELTQLSGHVIVCGYGRMGKIVCGELERQDERFVVVDRSADRLAVFPYAHGLPLVGDAAEDEILRKAGVDRARALVTVVASDADNLYITLSARLLAPGLFVVARAEEEEAETKLRKVGANKVISPYLAGGHRAVQAVLRPTVLHFMEMATRPEFLDLQIEEVKIAPHSRLAGHSIRATRLRQDLGILVVGVLQSDGELIYNPSEDTVLAADSVLIVLGKKSHLLRAERMAEGKEPE